MVCAAALALAAWSAAPAALAADRAAEQAADTRMAAGHAHDSPVPTPAATTPPVQATTLERVAYGEVGGQPVYGWLARPRDAQGKLPGLIVIHEWWGLNDNVRDEAGRLAAEGYVALAVDLYGGRSATEVKEAMGLSQGLRTNPGPAEENLRQAYRYLAETAGAPRIGTIGWCLGGRWSLKAALLMPNDLDATVIYYGSVDVPEAELEPLGMPVLGLFGEKDPVIPLPTIAAFEGNMKKLGKRVEVHIYEGAQHAFANPSGGAYQAAAAEDSWRRTIAFLREHLQAR
jgi:carboxymethylenebutenolidase